MHANGNVISMNALNTIVANAMEEFKLGEVGFDENDLFSPPGVEEKVYGLSKTPWVQFQHRLPLIMICLPYMMIIMIVVFWCHLLWRVNFVVIILCLLHLMRIIMIATLLNLLPLQLTRMTMLMLGVVIILCMRLMIRMLYVIVILLSLFMMLLEIIMREENMVVKIFMVLKHLSTC